MITGLVDPVLIVAKDRVDANFSFHEYFDLYEPDRAKYRYRLLEIPLDGRVAKLTGNLDVTKELDANG